MDILYISGTCLTRNTSANMSHNAFVQGLLENNCNVDIIMADDSWGEHDELLPIWEGAEYYTFPSVSVSDRIRRKMKGIEGSHPAEVKEEHSSNAGYSFSAKCRSLIRSFGKKAFYFFFKPDPIYPLEKEWLKNARHFQSKKHYDLVISNSSPAASHKLASELINQKHINCKRWIQIWEDPWYHDLYGGHSSDIEREEHLLLSEASEIVYVSPLTLMYQKKFFPDCSPKMTCIPLPALRLEQDGIPDYTESYSFGYFGDYYSKTRNILPFYEAVRESGYQCYIYGDSDLMLDKGDHIDVSGRVTLDNLQTVQNKTTALVHICNLRGGQIPGKIYHYSVTDKPILFILDGTEEEQKELVRFFGTRNRYYFCHNTVEEIRITIEKMASERKRFFAVNEFLPKQVVEKLLK